MIRSLFLVTCLFGGIANADSDAGNGGDLVLCEKSSENQFEGFYSLDYMLSYRKTNDNADIVPVKSWTESANRILDQLNQKSKNLAESFKTFVSLVDNLDDYNQMYFWDESAFGLIDVKDENIRKKVPANCYEKKDSQTIRLHQIVVRRLTKKPSVVFEFDYDSMKAVKTQRPLQHSMVLVHEWLWSHLPDAHSIRTVNRILHSENLEKMNSVEFANILKLNGFVNFPFADRVIFKKSMRPCNMSVQQIDAQTLLMKAVDCHPATQEGLLALFRCVQNDEAGGIYCSLDRDLTEKWISGNSYLMDVVEVRIKMDGSYIKVKEAESGAFKWFDYFRNL